MYYIKALEMNTHTHCSSENMGENVIQIIIFFFFPVFPLNAGFSSTKVNFKIFGDNFLA